jgi:alpha/beta superfamily hydrolase
MQLDLPGPAGRLEALLEGPDTATFAALVCHPHPSYGGTMHTHAAYRIAKAVVAVGGAALRFNFRGVGRSAGRFDAGAGEAEDTRAALDWLARERPGVPLLACGFSFGAWMTLLAAGRDPRVPALLLAGVALRAPGGEEFRQGGRIVELEKPIALVQGEHDELASPAEVEELVRGSRGPRRLAVVRGASHLFVEDLPAFQREVESALRWLLEGAP